MSTVRIQNAFLPLFCGAALTLSLGKVHWWPLGLFGYCRRGIGRISLQPRNRADESLFTICLLTLRSHFNLRKRLGILR